MRRRSVPSVAPAVVLTLALAACGPADGSSDHGTPDTGTPQQQTLTVLAAASLTEVFELIADDFEADHPGVTVEQSFAASSTIVAQVNEGAPADVIALAGTVSLEPLAQEHRHGEVSELTTNSLQLAVPPDNPAGITGVQDLAEDGLRLVVCEEQVPCGAATARLFQTLGITPAVASQEHDVRAALTKVELGEADVGVVYRTDVARSDRVLGVGIPDEVNVTTTYPVLAVSDSPLAGAFVDEALSERGQTHLADAGFVAP